MAADVERGAAVASIARLGHIAQLRFLGLPSTLKSCRRHAALMAQSGLARPSLSHSISLPPQSVAAQKGN